MKKTLFILCLFISFLSYGQVITTNTPGAVPRSNKATKAVEDFNLFVRTNLAAPRFNDTTSANQNVTMDTCGRLAYTYDVDAFWIRRCFPSKHWEQISGSSIINIFNNSTTNITFLSQVDSSITIQFCTGADACDTITFTTNITNIDTTSIHFIDSTHFAICGVDTVGGVPIEECDTVEISTQQLYAFQNWIYQPSAGIVEAGTSPLIHDSQFPTGNFHADMGGSPFYNYPIRFYQDQSFMNGSGIVSFRSNGQSAFGATPNVIRLGVNFWGDTVNNTPTVISGYFTDATRRFGYGIGTNISANGDYGMNQDDSVSKNGGIFFHTTDVTNDEGVSIYAAPSVGGTYISNLSQYFNAHFRTNGDVRWPFYPSSRSNGYAGRFLTTDSAGNMQLRAIPNADSCGWVTGGIVTWDSVLTFDVSVAEYALCCDNVFRTTDFDTVQLAEPDTGFLRYDAVVVGVNGVEVVQGVESTDPEQPQLDSCQTLLTYILVIGPHDDTVAAIQNICPSILYDENYVTEYVVSSTGVTVDTVNTVSVAHLTKSMDVGSWTSGRQIKFIYSPNDISDAFALKFYINLKAVVPLASRIRLDWMNGNTVVSSQINLGGATTLFGFNRSVLGYQTITIPINAWTFTSKNITTLRVTLNGSGSGFYMDWVQLQGCGINTPAPSNVSFASGNLLPLFTTSVANPTSNITQSFTQVNAPAYTVFGNPFDTAAARQDLTINLSTPQTVGLLNVERIAPCGEGYFIATVDGVQTCVPNPTTEITQIKVMPPLFIDTTDNEFYDTLSIHLIAGTNITLDSTADGTTINATGPRFGIEDNLGIQDRRNAMQGFGLTIDSLNTISLNSYQASGGLSQIYLDSSHIFLDLGGASGADINVDAFDAWAFPDGIHFNIGVQAADNSVSTSFNTYPDRISFIHSGVSTAARLYNQFVSTDLNVASPLYVAVWDADTLKSAALSSILSETLQQVFNTEVGGSVLTKLDTIQSSTFGILMNGAAAVNTFRAINTTGSAVKGETTSGNAIFGVATTGVGGAFSGAGNSATAALLSFKSTGGVSAVFTTSDATTNTVTTDVNIIRASTGTPANGIGTSIDFLVGSSTNASGILSNQIISKWTDATNATRTSQLIFTGVNSAATGNILVISGDGSTQMPKYGAGAATFDASGNITSVSDIRLKDIQGDYNGGLNELMNVTPIIYKWNEKSGMEREHNYIGFSAQNIQSALGGNAIGINKEGYLSIQDRAILATLVNAIKEQQKEIYELRKLILQK